jgi:hypothetical protein
MFKFLRWGVISTSPKQKPGGPPLVGCLRLLIQYIRSYPPHLEAVPPSTTSGRAMSWKQRPTSHSTRSYLSPKLLLPLLLVELIPWDITCLSLTSSVAVAVAVRSNLNCPVTVRRPLLCILGSCPAMKFATRGLISLKGSIRSLRNKWLTMSVTQAYDLWILRQSAANEKAKDNNLWL